MPGSFSPRRARAQIGRRFARHPGPGLWAALLGLAVLLPGPWTTSSGSARAESSIAADGSAPGTAVGEADEPAVLDLGAVSDLAAIVPRLASKRIVFVGEAHDRLDHHLNQLAIIRSLRAIHRDLAIGVEWFEQDQQSHLDAYVAGELSEAELLRETGYYDHWTHDFRFNAPILRFARSEGIPVVALNLPAEIVRKVGRSGLESLTEEEREQIPTDIDRSVPGYREHLREVFDEHPEVEGMTFERFEEAQLLWDEGMAERAFEFLRDGSAEHMVILAGGEHIAYGRGIPIRLTRRLDVPTAIVLNGLDADLRPGAGDFVLLSEERRLPAPGRIGVALEPGEEGLAVAAFSTNSAAAAAGMQEGDLIVAIDDAPVRSMRDLRVEMWDKQPGDGVVVKARRKRPFADEVLVFELELR